MAQSLSGGGQGIGSVAEVIRRLYRYACGYCGITETDVGSEMTVDHFMPRTIGGSDELDNLQAQIDELRSAQ